MDNAANRSLGRVGMSHGSCVQSSTSCSASPKTYVDNAVNRSLGRVGNPRSTSSSASPKTYVDNAANRSLGRVGMPYGSCGSSSTSQEVYVDNAANRKLDRVGKPIGTTHMVSGDCSISGNMHKTYVDNERNRHLGRVGKPIKRMIQRQRENEIVFTQNLEGIRRCLLDLNFHDPDYPAYFDAQHSLQLVEVEEMWQKRGLGLSTDLSVAIESKKEIIPLFGIVVEKDHFGIVMEYLPKTLFHAIFNDEETRFSAQDKTRLVREVVCAIEPISTHRFTVNQLPTVTLRTKTFFWTAKM